MKHSAKRTWKRIAVLLLTTAIATGTTATPNDITMNCNPNLQFGDDNRITKWEDPKATNLPTVHE